MPSEPVASGDLQTREAPQTVGDRAHHHGNRLRGSDRAVVVAELSSISAYYDRTIELLPSADAQPALLGEIDCREKIAARGVESVPDLRSERDKRTLILVQTDQHGEDAKLLLQLQGKLARTSRVAIVGRREIYRKLPAGWQQVRRRHVGYTTSNGPGFSRFMNRILPAVPFVSRLSRFRIAIVRAVIGECTGTRPSLSIIIPARNERGNIASSLARLPDFGGAQVEVVFVEGHSTDGTWEEIERVVSENGRRTTGTLRVRAMRQSGRGKADAVRVGFEAANGDLLAILDADLTMPPERLVDFYHAYCDGRGDFINGDRLSLPMGAGAMRPLNNLGNRFFAWALSHTLDIQFADALCGTKLFPRHDWRRFTAWRADFGERDPFGDFDLLFPAAALALGCVNVPIRYAARTYGDTNIHRFRDGARLLAMTAAGWWYLRAGKKR